MSADGRYVAFYSSASNLVANDTNGVFDVFVRDTTANQTTRVSVASDGTEGNDQSTLTAISADGRYVVFASNASNLVRSDTNGYSDVFVRDTQTNQTARVSVASDGTEGNGDAYPGAVSADGRYIAFWSGASNLVAGDTNAAYDVFVRDTMTNQTTLVSVASDGTQANGDSYCQAISADGRYLAFTSMGSNLVQNDVNGVLDVFLHDRTTRQTSRVSVASDDTEGDNDSYAASMSADGRFIAFTSIARTLVPDDSISSFDVFVRDMATQLTTRVSVASDGTPADNASGEPVISANGRFVAFLSNATNLTSDDSNRTYDVFLRDLFTNDTTRVSLASDGLQGDNASGEPAISADGQRVAFLSNAAHLVAPSTTGWNVLVRDRRTSAVATPTATTTPTTSAPTSTPSVSPPPSATSVATPTGTASPTATATPASTVTPTVMPTPTPTMAAIGLRLTPSTSLVGANAAPTDIQVVLDAGAGQVDAVMLRITYDASKLTLVDTDAGVVGVQVLPGAMLQQLLANTVNPSAGTIDFASGRALGQAPASGTFVVATLRVQGAVAGTWPLAFAAGSVEAAFQGVPLPVTTSGGTVRVVEHTLGFMQQPVRAAATFAFGLQPVVAVLDGSGQVAVMDNSTVVTLDLAQGSGPSGAALTCAQRSLVATSGIARFAGCTTDLPGAGYELNASAPDTVPAGTAPFNVTLAGDTNGDCRVSILDFSVVVTYFGKNPSDPAWTDRTAQAYRADLDGSERVTVVDFSIEVTRFGASVASCPPPSDRVYAG